MPTFDLVFAASPLWQSSCVLFISCDVYRWTIHECIDKILWPISSLSPVIDQKERRMLLRPSRFSFSRNLMTLRISLMDRRTRKYYLHQHLTVQTRTAMDVIDVTQRIEEMTRRLLLFAYHRSWMIVVELLEWSLRKTEVHLCRSTTASTASRSLDVFRFFVVYSTHCNRSHPSRYFSNSFNPNFIAS